MRLKLGKKTGVALSLVVMGSLLPLTAQAAQVMTVSQSTPVSLNSLWQQVLDRFVDKANGDVSWDYLLVHPASLHRLISLWERTPTNQPTNSSSEETLCFWLNAYMATLLACELSDKAATGLSQRSLQQQYLETLLLRFEHQVKLTSPGKQTVALPTQFEPVARFLPVTRQALPELLTNPDTLLRQ